MTRLTMPERIQRMKYSGLYIVAKEPVIDDGMNYVHGGSSPREMIIPVIDLKMDRDAVETHIVQIMLVSLIQKNLVAYDKSNDVEAFRHEVIMDVAFTNVG